MRVREAKDFLVSKIQRQAELENVPLEDDEVQMLYFTEQGEPSPRMQELADRFDSKYDTRAYEKKISGLIHGAYKGLKKEHSPELETWTDAIRTLKKGDHYILVMSGDTPNLANFILVGLVLLVSAGFFFLKWLTSRFAPPNPRVLQLVLVCSIIFGYLLRHQIAQTVNALLERTIFRWLRSTAGKNDG